MRLTHIHALALAMYKHAAWALGCSAVTRVANGAESSW